MIERYVKRVLDCCGFHSDIGLRVLSDKSLITIEHSHIRMHDMLQELGKKIVQEDAPSEPWKWSRLWDYKDFQSVMYENTATDNVEAIWLIHEFSRRRTPPMTSLRVEALSKMSHLRPLRLYHLNFSGSLSSLPNQLQYLEWEKYPFTYFPSSSELTKLVELILPYSSIKQLWKGVKPLNSLRVMNLRYSENLLKTPDFTGVPNLEELNLEACTSLVQIHQSIGLLRKLVDLNLSKCTSLISLPSSIFYLGSLEVLNLHGCSKLSNKQLLEKARHAKQLKLCIGDTDIQCQSTSSIHKRLLLPFRVFNSRKQNDINSSLMPSLPAFSCLRNLDVSFCNLPDIPDSIGSLHCLERLDLAGNNFVKLPRSIKELPRLQNLNLEHCKLLTTVSKFPLRTVFPVARELRYWKDVAGLCIFDCPKLVGMEKSWSSLAFSWMIQVLQVHKECSPHMSIVIPGNQIPSWFNNQRAGCSVETEPIPDVHDSNWIGVVFCAAFVIRSPPPFNITDRPRWTLYCDIWGLDLGYRYDVPVTFGIDVGAAELDHLCLFYFPRQALSTFIRWKEEKMHNRLRLRLHAVFGDCCLTTKNCGARLVFKQDLEEMKSTMSP